MPRTEAWLYIDVAILAAFLALSSWLTLKKRSRNGIVALGLVAIAYFGFYRRGCVCAVGALQNIAQAATDSQYGLTLPIAAFFALPVATALFAGRTFCAGVCPFGAIQDILNIKPLRVPSWLDRPLSILPWIYLGLATLFSATGIGYLICRFDPFVGLFRFSATIPVAIFSAIILVSSVFIGRPYCRWLCPYGAILNAASRLSKRHASITPAECVDCRLCENSCPVDAIELPRQRPQGSEAIRLAHGARRAVLAIPAILVAGVMAGYLLSFVIAPLHRDVALYAQVSREAFFEKGSTQESAAFWASGETPEDLRAKAERASNSILWGSLLFGLFVGAVFSYSLIASYKVRRVEGYRIHQGRCVSCGRCFDYCPVGREISGAKEGEKP